MRLGHGLDEITGSEDTLDGRQIAARLEHLQGEADSYSEAMSEWREATGPEGGDPEWEKEPSDPLTEEEREELAALVDLYSEIGKDSTLIADHYFETYARQLAEDVGAIDESARWPCTCIDWERAARELAMDYSQVEYRGTTYYVRD